MKEPGEYLKEYKIDNHIVSNKYALVSCWMSDLISIIQKESYNQAIKDSIKSLQNYEMIWGNGAIVPSNQFEREILKLKIK